MTPETVKPKTNISKTKKTQGKSQERSHVLEVSGLCVNCNAAENCMHLKNCTKPVLFCEDFCESGPRTQTMFRKVASKPMPSEEREVSTGLKGLCVNCDFRETCTHAQAEGGVWHCENYS
ncbi:MAG: hypothetical protein ABIC40_03345 [bacterium]